jgi:hypothetical protein
VSLVQGSISRKIGRVLLSAVPSPNATKQSKYYTTTDKYFTTVELMDKETDRDRRGEGWRGPQRGNEAYKEPMRLLLRCLSDCPRFFSGASLRSLPDF